MFLNHFAFGDHGEALVILHGLFGQARNWSAIAKRLAAKRRVFTLDLRNHGASFWSDTMTYDAMAEDVAAFLAAQGLEGAALLGHSMGGKVAMRLALTRPALIGRLVVADMTPASYDVSALAGYIEAMRAMPLATLSSRAEAETWLESAVPEQAVRLFLTSNLINEGGVLRWQFNLDVLAAAMPAIASFPDSQGARYDGPALFVHGANSAYLRPKHRPLIQALFPKARLVAIKDAGHWLHAERPEAFIRTVTAWLDGVAAKEEVP